MNFFLRRSTAQRDRRPGSWLLALCLLVTLFGCSRPQVPFAEDLFFDSQHSQMPAAKDCERCHQEIYLEWENSAHAKAWTSESFQKASSQGRASECATCHASAPIGPTTPPRTRNLHTEEGVTCITCHLSTEADAKPLTMRGPIARSLPVDVHPVIEGDSFYLSSELCGKCHESVYGEWQAATAAESEPKTCQSCHMPSVRRTVESVNRDVFYSALPVALEKEQDLRKHLFAVPDSVADDLKSETFVRRDNSKTLVEVAIENLAPHSIPSGDFGKRELRIRLQSRDAAVSWQAEEILNRALGEEIAAKSTRTFRFEIPRTLDPRQLELTLERWDRSAKAPKELLRQAVVQSAGSTQAPK